MSSFINMGFSEEKLMHCKQARSLFISNNLLYKALLQLSNHHESMERGK
jgi:hypothetical protein